MMRVRGIGLIASFGIALVGLSAVALFAQHQLRSQEPISEISIEHTQCFGVCPVYKLTIYPDNTAIFIGQRYTDKIGTYRSYGRFDRLSQAIRTIGFYDLKDHYPFGVTDQPHVITTIMQGKHRKTIDNYADSGPLRLWEIQTLIDGAVAKDQWTKISDSTAYPKAR